MGFQDRMPEKKKPAKQQQSSYTGPKSDFVPYTPTEAVKAEVRKLQPDLIKLDEYMTRYFDGGYKLTFKYDDYSSAYAAWLIAPNDAECVNQGMILAIRGRSMMKALTMMVYVLSEVLDERWPRSQPKSVDDLDW